MIARRPWAPLLLVLTFLTFVACGGDDDDSAEPTSTPTPTAAAVEPLRILVTNDDGVGGEGISLLVDALLELDDVEVTVVAPLEDQSGTGGQTTPTPLTATDAELIGGAPAVAVDGFPADSVVYALAEVLDEPPHVVVSGINAGQNMGPIVELSGTVGAARKAVSEGIPALAVSQGLADPIDYPTGVELAIDWVEEHRDALLAGEVEADAVANLNVPSCATGEVRGVVEVPTATDVGSRNPVTDPSDCTSTATDPADDIAAFLTGYAPLAEVAP
ncbi:MAG TPA: 5'/3'-nucleotidase SurE [Acidimicrobiales bacterium]|nr:5'/3'-nucleotidase SurE [Acidimicrobiales bacterium]